MMIGSCYQMGGTAGGGGGGGGGFRAKTFVAYYVQRLS